MLLKSIVNYGYSKVSNELTAIKSTDGNVENELEQTVSKIETKYMQQMGPTRCQFYNKKF